MLALAAIQGLAERLQAQETEIQALRAELERLATAVQEPRAPAFATSGP